MSESASESGGASIPGGAFLNGRQPVLVVGSTGEGDEQQKLYIHLGPIESAPASEFFDEYLPSLTPQQQQEKSDSDRIAALEQQLAELKGGTQA